MEDTTQKPMPSMGSMKTLKKIDWKTAAKLQAVLMAAIYGLMGAFAVLGGLFPLIFDGRIMPLLGGFGLLVVGVVGGGLVGWLAGAFGAAIYNVAAGKVGGIKVDIS